MLWYRGTCRCVFGSHPWVWYPGNTPIRPGTSQRRMRREVRDIEGNPRKKDQGDRGKARASGARDFYWLQRGTRAESRARKLPPKAFEPIFGRPGLERTERSLPYVLAQEISTIIPGFTYIDEVDAESCHFSIERLLP